MNIRERLTALRALMAEKGFDIYMVPTDDCHQSEYVGEHFKARAFITGFTGSAGTAVITPTEAGLWTDGRYFIQAEKQLEESGVRLFKMGNPGVPSVEEFITEALPENGTLPWEKDRLLKPPSLLKTGRSIIPRILSTGYGKTVRRFQKSLHSRLRKLIREPLPRPSSPASVKP